MSRSEVLRDAYRDLLKAMDNLRAAMKAEEESFERLKSLLEMNPSITNREEVIESLTLNLSKALIMESGGPVYKGNN